MYALACENANLPIQDFLRLPKEVQLFHLRAGQYKFKREQELQNKRFESLQESFKQLLKAFR